MTQAKILPTVGRVVWFFDKKRHPGFHQNTDGAPYAAIIAAVCTEDVVNLTVSDASGTTHGRVGVPLSHEGGQPIGADYWCEWMPYQKGQAAKTEAVERSLGNLSKHLGLVQLPVVDPGAGSVERQIQALGLTAPRVTPADIEAEITHEFYFKAPRAMEDDDSLEIWHCGAVPGEAPLPQALHLLTFCVLVLRNGFTVTGESACASPENFDAELGRKIARQNAVAKMWPLLGFRLRDHLHERAQFMTAPMTGEQLTVRRTTFEDLVRHGLAECIAENQPDSIVNGMPWSFTYKGFAVSHENDNCYLISGQRFERGQELFVDSAGKVQIGWPAGECSAAS